MLRVHRGFSWSKPMIGIGVGTVKLGQVGFMKGGLSNVSDLLCSADTKWHVGIIFATNGKFIRF